jgi:hypothetical protein
MAIFLGLPDPKRVNRAIFGAWFEEDIYDRFCTGFPHLMRAFRRRIPQAMRDRGLIFVHVPRVAGTSICRALYGRVSTRHHSMRYYRALDPAFCAATPSFALLRDPFDRFASAFFFIRAGGTPDCRLAGAFEELTAHIETVDDYLDFLEGRADLDLDFTMRPQSWFVCDLATGTPLVDELFLYGDDNGRLAAWLARHGVGELPWLNRAERTALLFTPRQRRRIERLYAGDFALIDSVRRQRCTVQTPWAIAAE